MTTYYVDTAVGNDGNAGTSEGAGNAWATIDHAMNTVAAGDKVWVKASGNYNETATLDTAGSAATPIVFEGYTSTTGDNGKATIDGQSTRSNCITTILGATYYVFKNFVFTNATSIGASLGTADICTFVNCDFTNNGGAGIQIDNNITFINCESNSNSGRGFDPDTCNAYVGCIAHSNTTTGIVATAITSVVYKCVVYNNSTGNGIDTTSGSIIGCTLDGENSAATGIRMTSETDSVICDNIIYDWATAVDSGTWDSVQGFRGYNLLNSNTTDYDSTGQETLGIGDVTGAPSFTDEANDDYTLGGSSPAIDAGVQPGGIT
jgi:hypothetical protein